MKRGPVTACVWLTLLTGACGTPPADDDVAQQDPNPSEWEGNPDAWTRLPDGPLSPRHSPALFDLGGRMLVLGGDTYPGCHDTVGMEAPSEDGSTESSTEDGRAASGPVVVLTSSMSSCAAPAHETRLRDGATFDFVTGKWAKVADAPVPVTYSSGAVIADRLYLWVAGGIARPEQVLLVYDITADSWREMQMPDELVDSYGVRLLAAADRLLAYEPFADENGRKDWLYDPAADSWSTLLPDPLKPSHDRQFFWVDGKWFMLGPARYGAADEGPTFQRAAVLDSDGGSWRRQSDSEIVATMGWSLVGDHIVSAHAGVTDGFGNYDRSYAYGGMLYTSSGHWSALPPVPPERPSGECEAQPTDVGWPHQEAGRSIVVHDGWALRVDERRWEAVPCNPNRADHAFSTEWVGDRLVTWGGYDTDAGPGQFPKNYKFKNDAWIWRPAA